MQLSSFIQFESLSSSDTKDINSSEHKGEMLTFKIVFEFNKVVVFIYIVNIN